VAAIRWAYFYKKALLDYRLLALTGKKQALTGSAVRKRGTP